MSYRVLWTPDAEQRLEDLTSTAISPEDLASAARDIDKQLFDAPREFGESRYEDMRVGFSRPLGVQFEVMDDVRTVIVHDVWRTDRK